MIKRKLNFESPKLFDDKPQWCKLAIAHVDEYKVLGDSRSNSCKK